MWPLQMRSHSGAGSGYLIRGELNASGFIEHEFYNIGLDTISVVISNPYSDAITTSSLRAVIRLMPCEALTLVLGLEERKLLDRQDSPCNIDVCKKSGFTKYSKRVYY